MSVIKKSYYQPCILSIFGILLFSSPVSAPAVKEGCLEIKSSSRNETKIVHLQAIEESIPTALAVDGEPLPVSVEQKENSVTDDQLIAQLMEPSSPKEEEKVSPKNSAKSSREPYGFMICGAPPQVASLSQNKAQLYDWHRQSGRRLTASQERMRQPCRFSPEMSIQSNHNFCPVLQERSSQVAFDEAPIVSAMGDSIAEGAKNNGHRAVASQSGRNILDQKRKKSTLKTPENSAQKAFYPESHPLELKEEEFLRIAHFIKTKLPSFVDQKKYYLTQKITGLDHIIEYDPETKKTFVLLEGKEGAFLGRGKKKVVAKALLFDNTKPEVVARGEQSSEVKLELEITKLLDGAPGIYQALAFTSHRAKGKQYIAIYSKLYSPGSLATVLEKNFQLTIKEKAKIILNILEGLESLHKNNVIHTDLSPKNYLVNISEGKSKDKSETRDIEAVISDFGRSKFASDSQNISVQGNSLYIAPEGIFREKLQGSDYFATDLYAVGCVFYQLFYGTQVPWHDQSYAKDASRSQEENYELLVQKINESTEKRRNSLISLYEKQTLTLPEAVEFLILRMVHPDPHARGAASELKEEMLRILSLAE